MALYQVRLRLHRRSTGPSHLDKFIGNLNRNVDRQFDIDSFLEPLINDLRLLAVDGVPTQRWMSFGEQQTLTDFNLRTHLLTVSGVMPAEVKVPGHQPHLIKKALLIRLR